MKTYEIAVDGWILGANRVAGEVVGPLSDAQAEYLLLYGQIRAIEEIVAPEPEVEAVTPRRRRNTD